MPPFINSFVGKDDAWHRAGHVLGRAFTKEDILRTAPEILSPITIAPVFTKGKGGIDLPVPTIGAAVRECDEAIVGAGMGVETYGLVQPDDAYEWGKQISGIVEAPLITAGLIREGTQCFFTYDTGTVQCPLGDLQGYLSVLNSYDMSWVLQALNSKVVVVCANTAAMAQASAFDRIIIRHTKNVEDRMKAAIAAMRANVEHTKATVQVMEQLATIKVRDFKPLLDGVLPVIDNDGRSKTMREKARDMVREYVRSDIADGVRGTGLAFVQGVNTYENWSTTIRGLKGRNEADVRAERQIDALVKGDQPLTRKATDLVLALA